MQETWRWFGPNDTISLENIIQAGASGVVSSLHQIPTGEVWPLETILERKNLIEEKGLEWSVVESIPVHNDIKSRSGDYQRYIDNYIQSIRNIAAAGINVVCYNFMPVVDWTRTNLMYKLANESYALRFDMKDFIAYDVYILKRKNAENDYSQGALSYAEERFESMSEEEQILLEKNIIAGLPGSYETYDRSALRDTISQFIELGEAGLRSNLQDFLREVIPVAEEVGVRMCIHPDDPPFSLFGLPRVVSTIDDVNEIINAAPSNANGLTLCAGSFGARADNDLVAIAKKFAPYIHFVHLRNVIRESDASFYEAEHLSGDNDMVGLIRALLEEEARREKNNEDSIHIPMRPDHGHLLGEEINLTGVSPGYSFAGRLKGLAELRGVIHTLKTII